VEGAQEEVHYRSGFSSSYSRRFEGVLLGWGVDGSVYHPQLVRYELSGEGALGWANETTDTSTGTSLHRSEFEFLGNFTGNASVLANKPYRGNLYVTSSHAFRDYDFFNRVRVDSLRYGANSGYSRGPVPFTISLARYAEDTDPSSGSAVSFRQTALTLDARNDRATGGSTFRYGLTDFERSAGSSLVSGIDHAFGLSDREVFGSAKKIEWRNNASYSTREQTRAPSALAGNDAFTADSHLAIEHPHRLSSAFDTHYLRNDAATTVTENYDAAAGVQHKLFASLTSGLRAQATKYSSRRPAGDFESTQYSGSWSEAYTKKLTATARLSVGGSLGYSHTDQQSSSTIQAIGEKHAFSGGGPFMDSFFLNLLNVDDSTIQLWDEGRTIRYLRNIDYSVQKLGGRTSIRLIEPNPDGLTRATAVIVDYDAASQGTGTIDGQFSDAQVRLDLFDGRIGIYARYYSSDNRASDQIVVEDVTSVVLGADYSRNWFRSGVEYEIHEGTFGSYTAARLYQSFTFTPDDSSALNITVSEGATDYEHGQRTEQFYSAIGRYHHGLTRHLGFDLEAGVSQRFGSLVDQFQAAVRPTLNYSIGQLSAKLAYDFEYRQSDITGEERIKHMLTLRVSRWF
jgi:hypothetical protein